MIKARTRKKTLKSKAIMKAQSGVPAQFDASVVSDLVLKGDLRKFTDEQKVKYYTGLCKSLGLNPLTKPFDLIILNDKEILYPNKGCAEQLRKKHKISIVDMNKAKVGNMYEVTVKAVDASGRYEIATGIIPLIYPQKSKQWNKQSNKYEWVTHPLAGQSLVGDDLANTEMKCETKAKRRVTFALCGLGMSDETEIESIEYPQAHLEDERQKAYREAVEKLKSLPENIRKGLEILGYQEKASLQFCWEREWNHKKILKDLNKIADQQAEQ